MHTIINYFYSWILHCIIAFYLSEIIFHHLLTRQAVVSIFGETLESILLWPLDTGRTWRKRWTALGGPQGLGCCRRRPKCGRTSQAHATCGGRQRWPRRCLGRSRACRARKGSQTPAREEVRAFLEYNCESFKTYSKNNKYIYIIDNKFI
jgi:hypothetical protein